MSTRSISRATAAVVAAVSAFALAGCGDSGGVGGATSAAPQNSTSAGGKVTLNYWTWFPTETTVKKAIAAYEAANPNVTINLREFEAADYQKQLPLALNGGEKLDIVGVQVSAMTNTVSAQLQPVSDWESNLPADWRDQLEAKPVEQAQNIAKDKTLYQIPMGSIGSVVMYYNPTILAKAGVQAVPATVEDLAKAAAAIKQAAPDVQPVVFAADTWFQDEMLFTIASQTSPTLSDEILYNGKAWNDPALVKALESYKKLFTSGAVDKATLSLKAPRPSELFTTGKAAFYFDGSWQNSLLSKTYREANKIALEDVGAAGVPTIDGGTPAMRAFAEGGLAIPKSSSNVAEAAKFIAFMTMGDGLKSWAPDLVLAPSKKGYAPGDDVLVSQAAKDGFAAVAKMVANAGSNRDSNQDFLNSVEGNAILEVLNGKKTAQAAADEMQKQWTSGRYPH